MTEPRTPSIDADLTRWRESRDVDALERVFDATAGRLQLIVARLVGDGEAARDAVQRAFLVVVQRPERWDPRRPGWPWLVGVAAREARGIRRSETKRRDRDARIEGRADGGSADPASLVADAEAAQRVREAIDRMAGEDRLMLTLHLVHGLEPIEVAAALERNAASVRSRLRRGLQRLRQSLARDGLVWSAAGLRMESALAEPAVEVRRAVLDAARRAAAEFAVPAAAAAAVTTGITWLVAGVVLLAVVGVAWIARGGAAAPAGSNASDAGSAIGEVAAAGPSSADRALADPGSDPRRPASMSAERSAAPAATRIRVVDAAGRPAAGVLLRHHVMQRAELAQGKTHEGVTDSAGELVIERPAERRIGDRRVDSRIVVHEPGIPPIERPFDLDAPPARLDEIRLPETGSVTVRLLDQDGRPVERLQSGVVLAVAGEERRSFARPLALELREGAGPHAPTELEGGVAHWPWCGLGLRLEIGVLDAAIRSLRPGLVREGPKTSGEHCEFVVRLVRLVELHASIQLPDGSPWDGRGLIAARVVTGDGERDVQAFTLHDGRVRIILPQDMDASAVSGLHLRLRFGGGQRVHLPLRLGPGRRHDLGTVVLEAAPLLASGRLVDTTGAAVSPGEDLTLPVRSVEPEDASWDGGMTWFDDGRFELRGDAAGVRRFEIAAGHIGIDNEVIESVRFAAGATDVLVPVRPLARLTIGFAHPAGEARRLDLVLEPLARGRSVEPSPFPHVQAERTVYGFGGFAAGTWRVVARLPGRGEPVWSSGWLDVPAPGNHEPEDLAAIEVPGLRTAWIRWVDGDGQVVPRDRVRESLLFVRDSEDPQRWHGRWFLAGETALNFASEPVDVVLCAAGHAPVLLRGVDADRDVPLEPLPDNPPPAEGSVHTWRLSTPGHEDQVLTGRPWPAAWFER